MSLSRSCCSKKNYFTLGNRLLLWGQLPKPDLDSDTPCKIWPTTPKETMKKENEYDHNVITIDLDLYELRCR
jgi:hypothetical protein